MKTSKLTGAALDLAVAKCESITVVWQGTAFTIFTKDPDEEQILWSPSTDWTQGGPIIEREKLAMCPCGVGWEASTFVDVDGDTDAVVEYGATPLIAAMRCYVASKLGDEIEIPKELKCQ